MLIADDHAVVRQGLRTFLELQEEVEVVGDVADGEQAVAAVVDLAPDVVLMDLVMPGVDGVEAIGRIAQRSPATRVIALTSFLDDDKVLPAVRAGAAGYLLKDVGPDDLVRAIRTVYEGGALVHPAVAARLMEEVAGPRSRGVEDGSRLTARERDVLAQIARGLSNKRIARELGISEATVKIHVSNVLRKLGVTDRTQAALHAVREGLVDAS